MQSMDRKVLVVIVISALVACSILARQLLTCSTSTKEHWTAYACATYTHDMVFDQNGYLWAVGSKGVLKLNPRTGTYTRYTESDGLADDHVYAVAVSSDDTLWFGTGDGVSSFDGEKWHTYQESYAVPAVATTLDESVWIGARLELEGCHDCGWTSLFDGKNWTSQGAFDGCESLSIAEAPDGVLWFGSSCGVASLDGKTWSTWTIPGPSTHNAVADIAVTSDGNVWVGSLLNLHRFDGEMWETYGLGSDLPSNRVLSIAKAPDSALWVGTTAGVSKYDGKTWTTYSTTDGLIDDQVHAIAVGPDNTLWFGTNEGISSYAPPD